MDLSIVIVSWNTRDYLRDCLNSVFNNRSELDLEVIVVDNNSNDKSSEMVRARFPQVNCIENESNTGFGSANNQGIRICKSENILLLNPDTVVLPGALSVLVGFMKSNKDVGAVGPRITNPDGTIQFECARNAPTPLSEFFVMTTLYKRFPKSRIFGHYLMSYWDHNDEREVEVISGACALLRKQALSNAGLFDEKYFMYAEDTDLFCRIRGKGWKIYYVPSARIVHHWGKSADQMPTKMAVEARKSMERYFIKHSGPPAVMAHRLLVFTASLCMIIACLMMYTGIFGRKPNFEMILSKYLHMLKWSIGA